MFVNLRTKESYELDMVSRENVVPMDKFGFPNEKSSSRDS